MQEELFDLQTGALEFNNLSDNQEHDEMLKKLRSQSNELKRVIQ